MQQSQELPLIASIVGSSWNSLSVAQLAIYADIIADVALGVGHTHELDEAETYIFIEAYYPSPERGSIEGKVHILRMTLDEMKGLISTGEWLGANSESTRALDAFDDVGKIILVGSVEFCQAAAHYLALSSELTDSTWGYYFIRKLTGLHSDDVMWMWGENDGAPKFGKARLNELAKITAAK